MLLERGWKRFPQESTMAIGFFDGFHRGHRRVLAEALARSSPEAPLCVVTFYPHPQTVLLPREGVKYLTLYSEKYLLLEHFFPGTFLYFLRFNRALRETAPLDFLNAVVEHFHPRTICVGENFRFGFERRGDSALLRDFFVPRGTEVVVVPSYRVRGEVVSSSRIREHLLDGRLTQANELLGFPFTVIGRVRRGRRIGRSLGFPTLNLHPPLRKLLPPPGVYTGRVSWENLGETSWNALIYTGSRPTFHDTRRRVVEVFVPSSPFPELYGQRVYVTFEEFVREEMVFSSEEALKRQIQKDLEVFFRKASAGLSAPESLHRGFGGNLSI
jgi:riboflavin kinase/FMN adenylyltransferase